MDARAGDGNRRTRRWWLFGGAAVVLAAVLYLGFGYFGVHTLFFDDEVAETGPVFDSGASSSGPHIGEPEDSDVEPRDGAQEAEDGGPVITSLGTGQFSGVGRYSGSGTVTVLTDGTDQRFVRFEDDFATDNGPDLFVYLGTGSGDYGEPFQYVELGPLKGNIGSQNYEIPVLHSVTGEPIDLDVFDHVAVWCKRFDATFAVAQLS